MGRYLRLCAVILSYEPLFTSMGLHPVLWTLIPLYVPSSHSMDHYSAMSRCFGLCAVIRFYGPSSHSMSRRHRSMGHRTALTVKSTIMCKLGYNVFSFL